LSGKKVLRNLGKERGHSGEETKIPETGGGRGCLKEEDTALRGRFFLPGGIKGGRPRHQKGGGRKGRVSLAKDRYLAAETMIRKRGATLVRSQQQRQKGEINGSSYGESKNLGDEGGKKRANHTRRRRKKKEKAFPPGFKKKGMRKNSWQEWEEGSTRPRARKGKKGGASGALS